MVSATSNVLRRLTIPSGWNTLRTVRSISRWSGSVFTWIVLRGDRLQVALIMVGIYLLFFSIVIASEAVPLADMQSVYYVYSGLIAGNVTLVTIVVTINQLLLPRIMYQPQEIEHQIDALLEYRGRLEHATGKIAPIQPSAFLKLMIDETRETAQNLGGLVRNEAVQIEDIDNYVETLSTHIDEVEAMFDEPAATFEILSALIETNYAEFFNRLRWIQATHEHRLSDEANETIDRLLGFLKDIDISRQYFKSVYIQRELSTLSQLILLTGLPTIGVLCAALLMLAFPADLPGMLGNPGMFFSVTLTVGMIPLTVLASFILRSSTIVHKTTATPPFVSPEHDPYFGDIRDLLPEE